MSKKGRDDLQTVISLLGYLKALVDLSNSVHFFDLNTSSENFFKELLNLIWGFKFENINTSEFNAAAIDLGDKDAKSSVQVTSDNSSKKIEETIIGFNGKGYEKVYSELVILLIK